MQNIEKILLAVDKSGASLRAAKYVADLIDGSPRFQVQMLHLELPPRMLEWGGSEDPEIEQRTEAERARAYEQMEQQKIAKSDSLFERVQAVFAAKSTPVDGHFVEFEEPLNTEHITKAILDAAREHGCGTIVVGRKSFSGLRRLFQRHVGEELVRQGEGIAVWVVE